MPASRCSFWGCSVALGERGRVSSRMRSNRSDLFMQVQRTVKFLAISLNFDHGRAFFLFNLHFCLRISSILRLSLTQDRLKIIHLIEHAQMLGSLNEGLQDTKGHFSQFPGWLVFMHALIKIGLSKGFQAEFRIYIDQVGGFYAVTNGKVYLLQHVSAYGIFAGEWLDDAG